MRSRFALFLVFAFLVASSGAAAQTPIPNAGMEDGDTMPAHWSWSTGENGKGEFFRETGIKHGGNFSFRVKKTGPVGYTQIVSDFFPVQPGKTYTVTAWVYPAKPVRRGVYFMLTQHRPDSNDDSLPNAFGNTDEPLVPDRWQLLRAQVAIREGNSRLRVHGIQAQGPSDICWDDFEIVEATAAAKPRYEPPVKEILPDIAPAQDVVRKRPRAAAKVEQRNGRPRLLVDGKPIPWAFYVSPFWNPQDAQIADFLKAGVRVYLVPLVLGRGVYADRGPWLGKDRYDFSEVDDLLWRVLRVDPEGYVIFYMACDPYRDWGADNPNDVTWDQNGQKAIVVMHPKRWGNDPKPPERFGPSSVSRKFREDVAETLRRLASHVEQSEAGKAVIGYHVAGLNDGQWFHWSSFAEKDLHLADYCPGAQDSFREWLKRRYGGDVQRLCQAWNRPDVTFETATVPPFPGCWNDKVMLNPKTDQDIADYTRFYSEGVAETVEYLASVLKKATPRPIICGTYYEDITCNSANHIALRLYLDGQGLDYLAGPAAYRIRMPGYQGAVRSVFASTLLHGKTYLTEQDWRSWHSVPSEPENNFSWGRAATADAHNAMVRRECGMMLAFGLGTWWYDMSGGWFRDHQIMAGISEAVRAFRRDLTIEQMPRADLAVFVSEESNDYISPRLGGTYRYRGILKQIEEMNVAGVPYRLYLQSDVGRTKLPAHRAYLFLNPYLLTDVQRRAIEDLKRDGNLIAFVHGPGIVGAEDPAATITSVTGILVRAAGDSKQLQTESISGDHPLLQNLDGCLNAPGSIPGPVFEVIDDKASPLARHLGNESVAIAARDFGEWKSVYVGCPGMTAEFLNNLARWAGCWVAAKAGDAVYANEHFLTIHAIFPGHKNLRLAKTSRVTDLTSERVIADQTQDIQLDMERGETRWFFLEPNP